MYPLFNQTINARNDEKFHLISFKYLSLYNYFLALILSTLRSYYDLGRTPLHLRKTEIAPTEIRHLLNYKFMYKLYR